jgi:hypothetical protein
MPRPQFLSTRAFRSALLAVCIALCASCAIERQYSDFTDNIKPCYPSVHSPVPNITDLAYDEARRQLLAAAWQPLQTKSNTASPDNDLDIHSGNGPKFWDRGYYELQFCSPTGSALCAFLFTDVYGNHLEVITEGEEYPNENAHGVVTRYHFLCISQ